MPNRCLFTFRSHGKVDMGVVPCFVEPQVLVGVVTAIPLSIVDEAPDLARGYRDSGAKNFSAPHACHSPTCNATEAANQRQRLMLQIDDRKPPDLRHGHSCQSCGSRMAESDLIGVDAVSNCHRVPGIAFESPRLDIRHRALDFFVIPAKAGIPGQKKPCKFYVGFRPEVAA